MNPENNLINSNCTNLMLTGVCQCDNSCGKYGIRRIKVEPVNNSVNQLIGSTGEGSIPLVQTLATYADKVKEFHEAFNVLNNNSPTLIENSDLRFKLMKEENDEYIEAAEDADLTEILDACVDKLYIIWGTILRHGFQDIMAEAFDEVHRSNMSKLGEDGKPIINGENGVLDETKPLGKILKGPNYFKPNLKKFLK